MNLVTDELTIIIIVYEEKIDLVFKCLENIKNFKIIIIDNADNISLKKKVEEKFQIYKYLLNKKNRGFTKTANQAIKLCDTEYILNLNADCFISEEDILKLIISHKKYKDCFITTPAFYDEESKLSYNAGCFAEKNLKKDILNLEGDVCVDTVLGTAILFKKSDILEIGLLDENFFMYFEDDDLCKRIKLKNKSVIQIFDAKAQHVHGQLKVKNFLKKIFIRNYNFTHDELYYYFKINKHHEKYKSLKKKLPNYIIKSIINFLILRTSQSVYYFAKVKAFYNFKKIIKQEKAR
jgi:GT2 family glycosyltransferase